jgi:predicted metal-dependent HD superfamily phosphohydrolase
VGSTLSEARFAAMWSALGATGPHEDTFARVTAAYAEPHRAYHDATHIGACLLLLDDAEVHALAGRPEEVEAALWFHDVVYDTHAKDNEERSADLAVLALRSAGATGDVAARVGAHVIATRDHATASEDGRLVVDIDLSILGADPATFERFDAAIRREYDWVDERAYVAGRAAVLRRFLERPSIFATELFRARFETNARRNITGALERLRGTAGERRP